ncbi:hypothetical protein ANO11243_026410 [Dothideomycetidae sp. 11243]|nr:hypothetical protein ANO11243_026410 [fungal sp. No.11243]
MPKSRAIRILPDALDSPVSLSRRMTDDHPAAAYSTFPPSAYDPHEGLMPSDHYHAHDGYSQQNPSYPFVSRPEVVDFQPSSGSSGRKFFVYLNANDDFENTGPFPTVVFGSRRCSGSMSKVSGGPGNFALSVTIPAFEQTGSASTQVPLYLDPNDGSGSSIPVGHFSYTDASAYMPSPHLGSPADNASRKRKLSPDQLEQSPEKRLVTQGLRAGDFDNVTSSPMSSNALSPYSATQQPINYAYGHTPPRSSQYTQMTPRFGQSPQTTAAQLAPGPNYEQYIQERPGISTSLASYVPGTTSTTSAPTLVRTSTLPDHGGPHGMTGTFNPYALYPSNSKAILKLEGDLNSMAENWSPDEVQTQRRLVRFRRSQTGSTITALFEPVTPEDHARAPGNIYVNCIWWKEKSACYITSVDTIQLLESLVAVRFTVEEKNRIRRNLEGFRPATVSKTRPDCEEFFKTIMGFPSPKPRNIEKDVKVFPWRILAHALKKIIGKYSASYGSAAGNMPPQIAGSASASGSPMIMNRHTVSPQPPTTMSARMPQFSAPPMAPTTLPSQVTMSMPPVGSSMQQPVSWHQSAGSYPADMSTGRSSWDLNTGYMDPSAQYPMRDQRIPSISQSLGGFMYMPPGAEYGAQRSTQA